MRLQRLSFEIREGKRELPIYGRELHRLLLAHQRETELNQQLKAHGLFLKTSGAAGKRSVGAIQHQFDWLWRQRNRIHVPKLYCSLEIRTRPGDTPKFGYLLEYVDMMALSFPGASVRIFPFKEEILDQLSHIARKAEPHGRLIDHAMITASNEVMLISPACYYTPERRAEFDKIDLRALTGLVRNTKQPAALV